MSAAALIERLVAARDNLRKLDIADYAMIREACDAMAEAANGLAAYDKTMQRIAEEPPASPDWSDYEDEIADAISDSMDMDWTSRDGAKAVVRLLSDLFVQPREPATLPPPNTRGREMAEQSTPEPDFEYSADHISRAVGYPTLGPQYFAANEIAERFMASFQDEHFKPLIDKFADDFRDKLWMDVATWLLSDTESNLGNQILGMVNGTINALLTGQPWALDYYVLAKEKYGDAPKVRAAILEHCRDQLTDERIADLEGELTTLREELRREREANRRY